VTGGDARPRPGDGAALGKPARNFSSFGSDGVHVSEAVDTAAHEGLAVTGFQADLATNCGRLSTLRSGARQFWGRRRYPDQQRRRPPHQYAHGGSRDGKIGQRIIDLNLTAGVHPHPAPRWSDDPARLGPHSINIASTTPSSPANRMRGRSYEASEKGGLVNVHQVVAARLGKTRDHRKTPSPPARFLPTPIAVGPRKSPNSKPRWHRPSRSAAGAT